MNQGLRVGDQVGSPEDVFAYALIDMFVYLEWYR